MSTHHPVRTDHTRRQNRQGQPLPERRARRGRRRGRQNGHLPRRSYRRIVKRRGKLKALVAVARSILVIIWNLLNDPTARFRDLGADYHATRINTERRTRNYVTQLIAMGYRVTLEPAA